MKILVIMTTNFNYNGISNVVLNYYKKMENEFVFNFIFPETSNKERLNGEFKKNSQVFLLPNRTKDPINYVRELLHILKNNKYDIVHIHGNSSTMLIETTLAKCNHIKGIFTHGHNTYSKYKIVDKVLKPFFLTSYTDALACGKEAGEFLYKTNQFTTVDNGIEVVNYKYNSELRNKIRKEFDIKNHEILIGHVGHFTEQKNQAYLIELIQKLNKINNKYKLLLVGDGILRDDVQAKVVDKHLSDKVIFSGNRKDINEIYSAMDLLVMPSRYEGLPLTLVEAQAANLKCFISNRITDEVDISKSIEYFDIDEYDNLVNKINEFTKESIKRDDLGYFDLVKKSKFNIENSVDKLNRLYSKYESGEYSNESFN